MNKSKLNELLRYAWLEGRTNGLQNNGKSFSEFLELKEVSEAINYTHSCKSDSEQLKNKIMRYLVTTEDGEHFLIEDYTSSFQALCDGLITIVRLADGKLLDANGEWLDLPIYGEC